MGKGMKGEMEEKKEEGEGKGREGGGRAAV